MLTILVRVKILTDALVSVASVWIRTWYSPVAFQSGELFQINRIKHGFDKEIVEFIIYNLVFNLLNVS
jgi:hypothetical protein